MWNGILIALEPQFVRIIKQISMLVGITPTCDGPASFAPHLLGLI